MYASQSDARNGNLAPAHSGSGGNNAGGGYVAPSPLDQIDPSSIETIEVFKGPSASALYGSDAANGVIVITTKHGRAGHARWNLALGQGANWLAGTWPTNYFRFGRDAYLEDNGAVVYGPICQWNNPTCVTDSVVAYQALNDPRISPFGHGTDQTADLNVSGGVQGLTYSLIGSTARDLGNLHLPLVEQQRYNINYGPIPGALIHPDFNNTWGITGQVQAIPTPSANVTLSSSLFTTSNQQGSLQGAIPQLEGEYLDPAQFVLQSAPLIQNDVEQATDHQVTSTNTLSLNWQARSWLPINATGGTSTIQRTDETLIPFGVSASTVGSTRPRQTRPARMGWDGGRQRMRRSTWGRRCRSGGSRSRSAGTFIPIRPRI